MNDLQVFEYRQTMGVSGHHTLAAARDALAKAGYTEHTPGVKAHPGVYKLLPQRVSQGKPKDQSVSKEAFAFLKRFACFQRGRPSCGG